MLHFPVLKTCRIALSACLLCAALGSAHAPTASIHTPAAAAPVVHKPAALAVLNPHLHLGAVSAAAAPAPHVVAAVATPHVTVTTGTPAVVHTGPHLLLVHSTVTPKWDAHTFISLHRGLATIHGNVVNPNGSPANDAHVALRKPGGRTFLNVALRHVTSTSANGAFTMTNVRPGTYRVFSIQAKKKGFSKVVLHAGSVEDVTVKI